MLILNWLNNKRIKDYPRLVFIASYTVLILNLVTHNGWIGGLTNYLMWGDFIDYYAAGKLFLNNTSHLYDIQIQGITQLAIIGLTEPISLSFYSYPPNAALLHAVFTLIPLPLAILFWCVLSVVCVVFAASLLNHYIIPKWLSNAEFSTLQVSILIFSSFAFFEGFEKGQSHGLTFLLIVTILIATIREKWFLAGFLAAVSTYKPQFVIGFLILWIIRGRYKAIVSFLAVWFTWNGIVVLMKGFTPYLEYMEFSNQMLYLPYTTMGFPNFLMVTPHTFFATLLPISLAPIWNKISLVVGIILIIFFALLVYKTRNRPIADQNIILSMAVLLPLLAFPYALLHDLLVLMPVLFILAAHREYVSKLKYLAIGIYIAMFMLPLLGYLGNNALTALIPITVWIFCLPESFRLLRT